MSEPVAIGQGVTVGPDEVLVVAVTACMTASNWSRSAQRLRPRSPGRYLIATATNEAELSLAAIKRDDPCPTH